LYNEHIVKFNAHLFYFYYNELRRCGLVLSPIAA